jgi:hypothetical protein
MPISRGQEPRQLYRGGGIMNLEPRQEYGLGSIVKSVKKAVSGAAKGIKSLAKSDVGKMALLLGGGYLAGGGGMPSFLGGRGLGGFQFGNLPGASLFSKSSALGGPKYNLGGFGATGANKGMSGLTKGLIGGGALTALLGAAQEGDQEAIAATRDIGALKGYLSSYYENLGYKEEEIPAMVDRDTAEYSSSQGGYATGGRVGAMYGGRIGFDNGGFEPFKYTSKIPRVLKEDPFGSDPLGSILNMSYTVRAPLIDIIRTVAKTATEATKLAAAAVKLGYDVTEPVREVVGDVAGGIYDIAKKSVQESGDASRFIQPTYYLERFGSEKNLTDDETRLKRLKRSIGRDDRDLIKTIENRIFEYDDAGMNQNEEDKKVSNKIQTKIDERNFGFADGGRIGYSGGTDFENWKKGKGQFEKEQGEEQLYREYLEDKRRQKIAEQRSMVAYGGRMKLEEGTLDPRIREIVIDLMDNEGFEFGEAVKEAYRRVESTENKANGGRIGYAFGSNDLVEQASGIMNLPINQNAAGVKELDLRETGGFIPPVGVKEKADDIPAMLSNNEFVFTADSVREFGDGDVNKGAQRMYDMMKKLENGGRV